MKWVLGNWKMHKTGEQARVFIEKLCQYTSSFSQKVALAVPFPFLERAVSLTKKSPIWVGAQNMHEEEQGAFTGEVSVSMIQDTGAKFVLLGHSERRRFFQDTEEKIRKKVILALEKKLAPILCVGETKEEREKGFSSVLKRQIEEGLELVSVFPENLFVAYEPVWAIGTSLAATPEIAEEVHDFLYQLLQEKWGEKAKKIPILYGGSVNEGNIASFLEKDSIGGVLVGGASLEIGAFLKMVQQ